MSLAQSAVPEYQALFCWENWALSRLGGSIHSVTSTAIPAGSFADMSAANLLTESLDSVWRSGSIGQIASGEISIVVKLDAPHTVDFVGFYRGNLRVPWAVELYRADPNLSAPVYASGWLNPVVLASLSDFGWTDLVWSLGPGLRRLNVLQNLQRLEAFHLAAVAYPGVRYVKLRFDVSRGINGDGYSYLQGAMVQVGRAFRPIVNFALDWSMAAVPRSLLRRTVGNSLVGRRQEPGVKLTFALNWLHDPEAWDRVFRDWQLDLGEMALAFIWPEPANRRYYYTQAGVYQLGEDAGSALAKVRLETLAQGLTVTEA